MGVPWLRIFRAIPGPKVKLTSSLVWLGAPMSKKYDRGKVWQEPGGVRASVQADAARWGVARVLYPARLYPAGVSSVGHPLKGAPCRAGVHTARALQARNGGRCAQGAPCLAWWIPCHRRHKGVVAVGAVLDLGGRARQACPIGFVGACEVCFDSGNARLVVPPAQCRLGKLMT